MDAAAAGGGQLFSVDPLERHAARGHGAVTSMAAGSDVIVLGTSRGWLVRHDFSFDDAHDLDLGGGRSGDHTVHRVFLDPGGKHCVATVVHPGGAETYYHHARWPRPKPLPRLRGLLVNAVAWNCQSITEASTKEVILGTESGQLFEMAVDEADKKEKYVKPLFELTEQKEGIKALQMETAVVGSATRYYVMAVTPTRLYSFTGIGSLETVFASYSGHAIRFMELPGEIPNSELNFFIKQRRAKHFGWLSGSGIYHGELNFGAQHSSTSGDENFVENKSFFDYSKLGDYGIKPRSFALSEFHFLLLIGDKIKVVNIISQQIVEELLVDNTPDTSRGIIGLCSDASTGLFYAYDESSIFQVSTSDEGRDMWQVYLDMNDYAAALSHCRNPFQRDQVYLVQADAAFAAKEYYIAASFYAKINYILSFEEISLKFISLGEQDALRTFLLRRLDNLTKDDKMQITMISTWATELYLDKINRLLLEDSTGSTTNAVAEPNNSEYCSIVNEFHAFLSDSKDVLDEATTMRLLESCGRVDELVYFAGLKEQYEIVVHHYIQQGEARKALEVLQRHNVPVDLVYKFAPDLIMLDAYETVESWMMARNKLNPGKLIPAMMRYVSEPHAKNETHEVIKYLEFCVKDLNNEDPGVHNLLLSLYAKKEDESQLLQFLDTKFGRGQTSGPEFFYDPKYALRLCLQEKRMRACVRIYSMMSMHEEAVALALKVDLELAKAEADKVEDDEELRKKLWLKVAKHVIEQEKGIKRENIKKAIEFLSETNNLLKIEDILPFFPDFVLIDDFKEEICKSLKDYNSQIEQLKQEMDDATRGADNIRNDIGALAQRYTVIDREQDCGVCRRKILTVGGLHQVGRSYTSVGNMAPFYVFPCGHAFHANCLIAHVTRCSSQVQAERILDLQKRLSLMDRKAAKDNGASVNGESIMSTTPVDKLRSQLDDAVASECPFCGDMMIKEISQPFILPEESEEKASWEIKPQPAAQKILPMTMSI
ncbi:vacuolar sorting protein 18-like [Phragmites australis]|uniref:vacuolar sorting protein 18-like n=1 Tax=Phragmites australis TaxID=29695 RepID=UPI002D77D5CB|nr:vacuolar sorting protein 18-like [Phragmites australis]